MVLGSYICKGEHFMQTWIKNGVRMTILVTAFAGAGAGLACSSVVTDRSARLAGWAGRRGSSDAAEGSVAAGSADPSAAADESESSGTGAPIGRLVGLAIAVLGAGLVVRRRRRGRHAATGQGEEG